MDLIITAKDYKDLLKKVSDEFERRTGSPNDDEINLTGELASQAPFTFADFDIEDVDTDKYVYASALNAILDKAREINEEEVPLSMNVSEDDYITREEIDFLNNFIEKKSQTANTPLINDCGSLCIGYCASTCHSSCQATCVSECGQACTGECEDNCTGGCKTTCKGFCKGSCTGTCKNECKGSCTGGCGTECVGGCSGCTATCKKDCTGSCKGGCTDNCAWTCSSWCTGSVNLPK